MFFISLCSSLVKLGRVTVCFQHSEIQRMDSSSLFTSIGIVFKSYEGFCKCISTLKGHVLSKPNIKKEFILEVSFDRTHFFSERSKQERLYFNQS